MNRGRFRNRAVALIAAYALAMQALLAASVPVDPVALAGTFAVLCTHDDGGGGAGDPARHDLPCAAFCAALGHGIAGPLPSDLVVALATPQAVAAHTPRHDWTPPRRVIAGPRSPRGPPLA